MNEDTLSPKATLLTLVLWLAYIYLVIFSDDLFAKIPTTNHPILFFALGGLGALFIGKAFISDENKLHHIIALFGGCSAFFFVYQATHNPVAILMFLAGMLPYPLLRVWLHSKELEKEKMGNILNDRPFQSIKKS